VAGEGKRLHRCAVLLAFDLARLRRSLAEVSQKKFKRECI
jgi:hypothetical protein